MFRIINIIISHFYFKNGTVLVEKCRKKEEKKKQNLAIYIEK